MGRLLEKKKISPTRIEDIWYKVAYTIETSLLESGAKPDSYNVIDLYKLAQPFVFDDIQTLELSHKFPHNSE